MKRLIVDIVIIAVGVLLLRMCDHRRFEVTETSDTVTVYETIARIAPQAVDSSFVGSYRVRLPKAAQNAYLPDEMPIKAVGDSLIMANSPQLADSADVIIPITQNHYKDSLYEAWVSGYLPRLDSIKVYPTTNYIYKTITKIEYSKRKRWNLGVGVGCGYNGREFSPYIGVGIHYKILEW